MVGASVSPYPQPSCVHGSGAKYGLNAVWVNPFTTPQDFAQSMGLASHAFFLYGLSTIDMCGTMLHGWVPLVPSKKFPRRVVWAWRHIGSSLY